MTLFLTIALCCLATPQSRGAAADLGDVLYRARAARSAQDSKKERALLEKAITLEGEASELARAARRLAKVEWMYYHEDDAARRRLMQETAGAEPAEAWKELANMELARERFEAALQATAEVARVAVTRELELWAEVMHPHTTIAAAEAARRAGDPEFDAVLGAVAQLRTIVLGLRGSLFPSHALLRGAVLIGDPRALRLGWESYYHIDADGRGPNAIDIPGMHRALEHWPTTADEFIDLIIALGASRLFSEAELLALDPGATDAVREDPRVRELMAYARTLRGLRHSITEYYRRVSPGRRSKSRLDRIFATSWDDLAEALVGVAPGDLSTWTEVEPIIARRFGAKVTIGRTGRFYGAHYGHIVADETRTIEQYGNVGELRFVALDNFVSNGFPGWRIDGGGSSGGWAGPDEMWQVRPSYAGRAVILWLVFTDQDMLRRHEAEIERATAADDEIARRTPHAYLPGLSQRLKYQGITRLRDRLAASGLAGDALREAFIQTYERAVLESSIFAHEGRHAIDRPLTKRGYPAPNAEFTAKLSEVAFAPEPRLALGGIFSPNIGNRSPHGVADAEIMKRIVKWMRANADEIAELDDERPLLPQFDRLTDEQIRTVFRSMDPLATGDQE